MTKTSKLGDVLPMTDMPTTSPILMEFGPSSTTSPDKSDLTNAPLGRYRAEMGVDCHFACKTYLGTH